MSAPQRKRFERAQRVASRRIHRHARDLLSAAIVETLFHVGAEMEERTPRSGLEPTLRRGSSRLAIVCLLAMERARVRTATALVTTSIPSALSSAHR